MNVVIAGGGIAGLTMALTCHQIGIDATVYESVPDLRPLGLGINLQPSAVRELHDLGLETELAAMGVPMQELALVGRDGHDVWAEPRGVEAGYRWPQYAVHRGELQMMLLAAVTERLGPDAVVTGRRVAHYEHGTDQVMVDVEALDGTTELVEATVVLACDGLHSALRGQMFPGEGGPRWGGTVLWRGMAHAPRIRRGNSYVVVGNTNQRFVVFPVSGPDPDSGMQIQNWIAERRFDPLRGWRRGDWNTRVDTTEFIDDFADWTFDWLDVPGLIRRTDQIFEYPMVDRDPVPHWVHGSVALLGDAAHAMYPVGSNGASQAIIDARVLGAAFAEHGVGRDALSAYESALIDDRSASVLRNRGVGPASMLEPFDDRAEAIFGDIDGVSAAVLERFVSDYRTSSNEAVAALNEAPPTISTGRGPTTS